MVREGLTVTHCVGTAVTTKEEAHGRRHQHHRDDTHPE